MLQFYDVRRDGKVKALGGCPENQLFAPTKAMHIDGNFVARQLFFKDIDALEFCFAGMDDDWLLELLGKADDLPEVFSLLFSCVFFLRPMKVHANLSDGRNFFLVLLEEGKFVVKIDLFRLPRHASFP